MSTRGVVAIIDRVTIEAKEGMALKDWVFVLLSSIGFAIKAMVTKDGFTNLIDEVNVVGEKATGIAFRITAYPVYPPSLAEDE